MHRNKINGKIYIGITSQNVKQRWRNGYGYTYNLYFFRSIIKYGWNNGFEHNILFTNLSEQEAKTREIELIDKYNSMNNKFGYNLTMGGEGTKGFCPSNETRLKMSKSQKGKHYMTNDNKLKLIKANKGKKLSKDHRLKLSESHKGKMTSSNTKQLMSKSHLNGKNNQRIRIICLETNSVYYSISTVEREMNIHHSSIVQFLKHKRKSAGKLPDGTKLHWQYLDEFMQQNGYTEISQIPNVIVHNENQETQLAS